mmetsp:Transcript_53731/g.60017  ORF Transcript_53731/g.60017 Transcript_53731/m.60017 type:complete len:443 (-) Transcript_53731:196-1524(-)
MELCLKCTRETITTGPCRLVAAVIAIYILLLTSSQAFSVVVQVQQFAVNKKYLCHKNGIRKSPSSLSFLSLPRVFYAQRSSKDLGIGSPESSLLSLSSSIPSTAIEYASNPSRKQERKRYNAELTEAFVQQTKKINPLLGIKSIGVDYGLVRTGLAVSIGYNPEALDVIITEHPLLQRQQMYKNNTEVTTMSSYASGIGNNRNKSTHKKDEDEDERRLEIQRSTVAQKVIEIARRENVNRIVIGLPLHKNGTEATQTTLTRKFACGHLAKLSLRILGPDVSIFLFDERYTSKLAAARIRSTTSQNHNNELYGTLDAESAKIILEHYYDNHYQHYNSLQINSNDDGGQYDNDIYTTDQLYGGELVVIPDVDLVNKLTLEYNETRRQERQQIVKEQLNRESRTKWRKLAMEEDRMREEKEAMTNGADNRNNNNRKKKKKKRKRK